MITADTLRQCAYLSTTTLEALIRKGYPKDRVVTSEFVGITNGGQFCYKIQYPSEHEKDKLALGKIFVWLENNTLRAEY